MGTMFDVVVYHPARGEAGAAIAKALDEVERLDGVLSHFKPDSDLSVLPRKAAGRFLEVDPDLYRVLRESIEFSRRTGGSFDVTIGPLLAAWKRAERDGRQPTSLEIEAARRCVGSGLIEMEPPDRVRLKSDCMRIDLGGIGKGYAVDRALAILTAAGITRALVNAGGSSIAASGPPPGRSGWTVELPAPVRGSRMLLLRHSSLSSSRQQRVALAGDRQFFGEILDPHRGMPAESEMTVSVAARRATVSDALSTALLMIGAGRGADLLAGFQDVSALWASPSGELAAGYREDRLPLEPAADVRHAR
jgi:thiamine biosynthesis lipoprotein